MVRLPDWKLLLYLALPLPAVVGSFAAGQVIDPLRPFTSITKGNNIVPDEIYEYCGAGQTGSAIIGITGGLMVSEDAHRNDAALCRTPGLIIFLILLMQGALLVLGSIMSMFVRNVIQ